MSSIYSHYPFWVKNEAEIGLSLTVQVTGKIDTFGHFQKNSRWPPITKIFQTSLHVFHILIGPFWTKNYVEIALFFPFRRQEKSPLQAIFKKEIQHGTKALVIKSGNKVLCVHTICMYITNNIASSEHCQTLNFHPKLLSFDRFPKY